MVAAATETLRNILLDALADPLGGAEVRIGPPQDYSAHEVSEGLINIFLYGVRPNATLRNEELVYRRTDGTLIRKPQLALDLLYLLTFYGDDQRNIPLLLLGRAVSTLHANPYAIPRFMPSRMPVRDTSGSPDGDLDIDDLDDLRADHVIPLDGTGLAAQSHALAFVLQPLTHDDLSQLWTLFSQVPYTTSVAYVGTVVLIEPDVVPSPDLPARQVVTQSTSQWPPRVSSIRPQVLAWEPAARIEILGRGLDAQLLQVRIGELEAPVLEHSESRLVVSLPDGLRAGISPVQVIHSVALEDRPGQERPALASEPLPLVVRPVVRQAWQEPLEPGTDLEDGGENQATRSDLATTPRVQAALEVAPELTPTSDVRVLLDPLPRDSGRGYILSVKTPMRPSAELRFSARIAPGTYLVRLQIPGEPHDVTSPLTVAPMPATLAGGADSLATDTRTEGGAAGPFVGPRLRIAEPFTRA